MEHRGPLDVAPLDRVRFPLVHAEIERGLSSGVAPGFVVGLWSRKDPRLAYISAWGNRRVFPSLEPMLSSTVFDLASLTKILATSVLTATLVERGWLNWDTPIQNFFPLPAYRGILVRHLLSHTSGLPSWAPLWERLRADFFPERLENISVVSRQRKMRERVLELVPTAPVGEVAVYSDVSALLMGFILEELVGMDFDRGVAEFVWKPMGISGLSFRRIERSVDLGRWDEAAATENCPWREGVLQGQVHDDNCWAMGGYGGHAGVFGRAIDILHFTRVLFSGYFTKRIMKALWTRVDQPIGCSRTLGWDTPSGPLPSSGTLFSPSSVGHLGFTGTSLWIDPSAGLGVTLLTNRIHPSRDNSSIRAFRPTFHDAIRRDFENGGV